MKKQFNPLQRITQASRSELVVIMYKMISKIDEAERVLYG